MSEAEAPKPPGRSAGPPCGLRILPLGGLGEIGMNCLVLEYADEILVVDCGLLFSDLEHFGVEYVIPDFTYLRERKDKVKGFLITHGHEDHIGALPFALRAGIRAPIHASAFAAKLIRARLLEHGLEDVADVRVFAMGETLEFRHFKARTQSVNHSIVDSAALFIDTPEGRIVHTGDFKIDPTPFYGKVMDLGAFGKAGDEGVLLLLSDSTNVERQEHSLSERRIYQKFEQLFAAAEGLVVVGMFASNVGRMGQVMEIARKQGKRVALAGRGMEQNARHAQEIGYLSDAASVLIPLEDIPKHARNQVIVLATGSQAEPGSTLMRAGLGEHRQLELRGGDLVVMSSRYIPGNEKAIGRMINALFRQGAHVLYEAVHEIHASGHATRPELRTMLELVKPRYFVPVHGEYRHLVHHAALAKEAGVRPENVHLLVNGDVAEIGAQGFEVIDHIEEPRVLVEGREGNDVTRLVLRDRRQMGEKGVVFALLVRETDAGRVIAGPEIITKGLASEAIEGWLVEEARKVARQVVDRFEKERVAQRGPPVDLQETLRVELRRFFNQNIGKKPVVLPIVLDL